MDQKIKKTKQEFLKDVNSSKNVPELDLVSIKYLGRKGKVNQLFQSLSPKEKAIYGKSLNQLKKDLENTITKTKTLLLNTKSQKKIDVTIPGIKPKTGHLHLLTQAIEEVETIFNSLGFVRRRYPEV